MAQFGVVLVTTGSEAEALSLGQTLVEEKLAACVSVGAIQSIYTWQGAVEQALEWQLVIKTDLDRFDQLEQRIRSLHSYDLPEIIALPIVRGSAAYLDWVGAQSK